MPRPHELLLAETAWLGRLARELVPAPDRDDLVQDVLLAALARRELPRQPRAWLATVARNRAAKQRARQRQRAAREQAVARPEAEAPPAADVALAFAGHRAVVNAVTDLDEPYRTAVLLRFWEGLPPRTVAQRTGVPVETARTHIRRGVERLRQVLDERAGDRRAWLLPLLQIDAVRDAFAAGTASATSQLVALLVGVLTMKKVLIPAVAAAALAVGLMLWRGPAADAGLAPPAANPVAAAAAAIPTVDGPAAVDAGGGNRREPLAAAPATGTLTARVVWHDGTPAESIGVGLVTADGGGPEPARTDADGRASFAGLPPGDVTVHFDRGAHRAARIEPGVVAECTFVVAPGVHVEGTVRTVDRQPVAGATVAAVLPDHPDASMVLGTTAADGTFALRDVPLGTLLVARRSGWQPSDTKRGDVWGRPGETARIDLVLGARAYPLRGTVLLPDGRPAPFARVVVAVDEDCRKRIDGLVEVRAADGNGMLDREAIVLRADAEGRFATDEVPWGDAAVLARWAGPHDDLVGCVAVAVRPGADAKVSVQLGPGAELYGTVRDTQGEPFGGVALLCVHDGDPVLGELDRGAFGHSVTDRRAVVGNDGTYRIRGLWPAHYDLRRELPDNAQRLQEVELRAGESVRIDLVVARTWDLRVVVRDAQGAPRSGWCVMLTEFGDISFPRANRCVTAADGTFSGTGLRQDELWLCVHAPATAGRDPFVRLPSFAQKVHRGQREVVAVVAPPTAAIALRVVGADGTPRSKCGLQLKRRDPVALLRTATDDAGGAQYASLPGGDYELELSSRGLQVERTLHVDDGQRLDLGDLFLPVVGQLACEVAVDGAAPQRADVRLLRGEPGPDGQTRWVRAAELRGLAGLYRSEDVAEGSYLLAVTGDDFAPALRAVDVRAGAPQRVRVQCERGVAQDFVIVLCDRTSIDRNGYAWLTVLDGERPLLVDEYVSGKPPDPTRPELTLTVHLVPGTYAARARGRTGAAVATIVVPPGGGPPIRIALR